MSITLSSRIIGRSGWWLVLLAAVETVCGDALWKTSFDLSKGNGIIIVPGSIHSNKVSFIFDTGSGMTTVDTIYAERLGTVIGEVTNVITFGANVEVRSKIYKSRGLAIGGIGLKDGTPVTASDLSFLRQVHQMPVYAIFGFDFIKKYKWAIDFDSSTLEMYDSDPFTPTDCGDDGIFLFQGKDYNDVHVWGRVPSRRVYFVLDTGCDTGAILREPLYESLVEAGSIEPGSVEVSVDATGRNRWFKTGILKYLRVGNYEVKNLPVSAGNVTNLGCRFLSHFRVIMDFPNGRLCLKLRNASP